MEKITLQAEVRQSGKGAAHQARHAGFVPAVLYGHGVKESTAIRVNAKDLEKMLIGGSRHVTDLVVGKTKHSVMVKEVQRDAVRGSVLHVDFYGISLKEKVHAEVPVLVRGADAVAKAGGIVEHHLNEVEVECLPADLPDAIEVNITSYHVGDHVSVGDLTAPKGVKILTGAEEVVVSIDRPRAEAEDATAAATADKTQPELVKPKKAED